MPMDGLAVPLAATAPVDPAATARGLSATGGLAWALASLFAGLGGFTDRQLAGLLRRAEAVLPDLSPDAAAAFDCGLGRAHHAATLRLLADYAAAQPGERRFARRLRRALAAGRRGAAPAFPLTEPAGRALGQLLAVPESDGPANIRLAATAQQVEQALLRLCVARLWPNGPKPGEEALPASFIGHLRGGGEAGHPRWLELFGAALFREYRADRGFRAALHAAFGNPFGATEVLLPRLRRWRGPLVAGLGLAALALVGGVLGPRVWDRATPVAARVLAQRLPSACDVQEWSEGKFAAETAAQPDRVSVLVTRLAGDAEGRASTRFADGFAEAAAFEVLTTCRPFAPGGASLAATQAALKRSGATLLLIGLEEKPSEFRLDFAGAQAPPPPGLGSFRMAGPLLEQGRSAERATALQLAALAALPYGDEVRLRAAAPGLLPRLPALERLLVAPPFDFDPATRFDVGLRFAAAASRLAEVTDDVPLMVQAIERWRWLARRINRDVAPLQWARVQIGLGRALLAPAPWDGRGLGLGQAADVFRAALGALSEADQPLDWALAEAGLGAALAGLGQGAPTSAPLREALAAYRAALTALPRAGAPIDLALMQSAFGDTLRLLGERERSFALLQEAVAVQRAALDALPETGLEEPRARVETNLGLALVRLGAQESGNERLVEGIASFRAALRAYTPETRPLAWGATQVEIGNALRTLATRETGTRALSEAAAAYRAALAGWTRARLAQGWAATQGNLGQTMVQIAERERSISPLEQAVAAFRAALEEWTPDRAPQDYAAAQNSLGLALWRLGELEGGTARLEAAVVAFRATVEAWRRDSAPQRWAQTQNNLGNVLTVIGARQTGTQRLIEAVNAYRGALEVQQRRNAALDWAMTQNNLAVALWMLGTREAGPSRLAEAEMAFEAALEERTEGRVPLDWASTRFNLALVRESLAGWGERTARLEAALADAEAALGAFRRLGAKAQLDLATDVRDRIATKLTQ